METIISPDNFDKGVMAFFTGKLPGDDLQRISDIAAVSKEHIFMPIQKHTDKVLVLDSDRGPRIADAVITRERDVLIGVQVADCVPVLVYDMHKKIIGAVHAGWRGTAAGILKKTVKTMSEKFYSAPADIHIAIGPGIRWCCYEVGHEVIDAVTRVTGKGGYYRHKGEKYCLDLPTANKYQALSAGVLEQNIWIYDSCTYCYPDKFYSYRFAKGPTGRQCGFIGLV